MRPKVPGELSIDKLLDRDHIHDRTVSAFLSGVDPLNGITKLTLNGFTSAGRVATLPVLWASFPQPGQGTWGRFMPFDNTAVNVSFDYDNTPHIMGYDILGPMQSWTDANGNMQVGDIKAGWSQIAVAQINNTQPYWVTLEQGEYDFMSSGGAYIRGYISGELLFQSGQTSASLVKAENRNYETTGCKSIQSQDSQFRFGEIRRPVTPGQPESQVPPMPDPPGKEFYMELYAPPAAPGTPGIPIGRFGFATQITMPGFGTTSSTPQIGAFGSPDIFYMEVDMPDAGTTMYTHEVDQSGNVSWHSAIGEQIEWQFDQATTVEMNSSLAAFSSTAMSISRTATTSTTEMCDTWSLTATTSYDLSTITASITASAEWDLTTPIANIMGTLVNLGTAPVGGVLNGLLFGAVVTPASQTLVATLTSIAPLGLISAAIWIPAFTAAMIAYLEAVSAGVEATTSLTVLASP